MRPYDHIERLGHPDTDGLLVGKVHVFPKLDGTCASVWLTGEGLKTASRRREVTVGDDNAGFAKWAQENTGKLAALFTRLPTDSVVYGEWLVPHTLKTYRDEAWRRFWIFDIWAPNSGYLPFADYSFPAASVDLDALPPLCTIWNPTEDNVRAQLLSNTFMVRDGGGVGEGVVVKNYTWRNAYGNQPWAKAVRNEFKEQNQRAFGTTEKTGEFQVEVAIAEEFCTPELVAKTRAKIVLDLANAEVNPFDEGWQRKVEEVHRAKVIPQLLGRVWHDLVAEEVWSFLRKHREPTVNFKLLRQHVHAKVKEYAKDLFS